MKKIITLIFSLCLCAVANAQIQTKFWGLELSHYYSLEDAKEIVSDKCQYVSIEDNAICAINGSFGGYDWDFIYFYFIKGYTFWGLYNVVFSSVHYTQEGAISNYDLLLNLLTKKYGEPFYDKRGYESSTMWRESDTCYSCSIRMHRSESKGGGMYWYINLAYCDHDLLDMSIEKQADEL